MTIFEYFSGKGPLYGSRTGSTFSDSRIGSVARARVTPAHTNTNRRETRKSAFVAAALRWRDDLSPALLAAWQALGLATTFHDPLGVAYNPQGRNLFIRTNALRRFYGLSWIDTAPASAVCPFFEKRFYFDPGTNTLAVDTAGSIPGDYRCFFDISNPIRPTVYNHKDPFAFNDDPTGSAVSAGAQIGPSGFFQEGNRIAVRSRDMASDGSLSEPVYYIFDAMENMMFLVQLQLPMFRMLPTSVGTWTYSGNVLAGTTAPLNTVGHIIPVAARLRHLGVVLRTTLIIGTPPDLNISLWKNGARLTTIELPGSSVAVDRYRYLFPDLEGFDFSAGDDFELFIFSIVTAGSQIEVQDCLFATYFEPGVFS